jgi:hypothetical protein
LGIPEKYVPGDESRKFGHGTGLGHVCRAAPMIDDGEFIGPKDAEGISKQKDERQ